MANEFLLNPLFGRDDGRGVVLNRKAKKNVNLHSIEFHKKRG